MAAAPPLKYLVSLRFLELEDPVIVCEVWENKAGQEAGQYTLIGYTGIRHSKPQNPTSNNIPPTEMTFAQLKNMCLNVIQFNEREEAIHFVQLISVSRSDTYFIQFNATKGRPLRWV